MTYRQTYQLFLEQLLACGGTPRRMELTINEFNAVENPDYRPATAFEDFVKNMEHRCSTCGRGFHTDVAQLDAETTCAECLSGSITET